ncbi:50S ribosomal protein L4 [Helicobacter sp. MIT 14-3879]|uniref:50S ribosomal protein L4 n=1 Tax=Helicobacter sp. MIT 14-3879 TaxID=2040649 RepID=UPI000E1EAC6A|nr:50S ribosomal protein L4 [Helicobacter sp. MIT 14-3879]RDU64117.1 50S ribosomal protein L4 [Helicobacter sp. MIT 14-3879]
MSKAIILDNDFNKTSNIELPSSYAEIKEHNLYLYIKYYLFSLRANTAKAKNRGEVSGGGKKPWSQKGGGRARAGSITSPVFVGGGVSHGPQSNRNYKLKINKKQKILALEYALNQKADLEKLYIVDSINIESGKTKDAFKIFKSINERSILFITKANSDKTFLAFRNIKDCYLIDINEINAYLVAVFKSVVIEKEAFDELIKGGK